MATIQKPASQLKRGDVVITEQGNQVVVINPPTPDGALGGKDRIKVWVSDGKVSGYAGFNRDADIAVEAPEQLVTREQLDLLLDIAEQYLSKVPGAEYTTALPYLLAELRPPEPPTLAEALALLKKARARVQCDPGFSTSDIDDILDRARRSGALK